ncbi:MFS transporter [Sinomonas mesophila]|uniref:MFS transporter n=1 Tax=Sinomonas mesophila TaxID=1531955 RepID=UPI001FE2CA96|nr:MFS transporter [Sinomonas mesophila]
MRPDPRLADDPARQRWHHVLRLRDYRLYLVLQLVASAGVWIQRLAQDWLVLQLSGSPAAVGVAVAAQFIPMLVLGPAAGVLVDALPKRRVLAWTQGIGLSLAAALGILAAIGQLGLPAVYASCVLLGVVAAVDGPARQVLVSDVVGDAMLPTAVALNNAMGQLGAMLGPALGGLILAGPGAAAAFGANALCGVAGIALLLSLRSPALRLPASRRTGTRTTAPPGPGGDGAARSGRAPAILAGTVYILRRPRLLATVALSGCMGAFGMNGPVVLTAFAEDVWHSGAAGFGLYNTVAAVGAVAGSLLGARLRLTTQPRLVLAAAGFGLAQGAAALMPTEGLFVAVLVLVGVATLVYLSAAGTSVQLAAEPAVRGRVMAVYLPLLMGGHALGGLLTGWLTEWLGVRAGLVATGALAVFAAGLTAAALWRLRRSAGRFPQN